MYASISDLAGKPGFPASYNATKKYLESRGCTRRLKPKGKGVEYLVGLDLIKDIDSRPTPTKNYYSVEILFEKLAGKPGIPQTISGLRRRIKAEEWESRKREGKGGGLEYLAPKDLFVEKPKLSLVPDIQLPAPIDITVGAIRKSYRLQIVTNCDQWCTDNNIEIGRREGESYWTGVDKFCIQYNQENPDKKLHTNTVARWWQMAIQQGLPANLAGKHGQHLIGKTLIDKQPEVAEMVIAMILDRPSHTMTQLKWQFSHRADIKIPSYQTVVRYRDNWKVNNAAAYCEMYDGISVYNSTMRPANGTHDTEMDYANQKWEMDGTKVDLICADGKRYTIMVLIDCFSRKFVYQIVLRANAETAYGVTLYKGLMELGMPEIISTDNGTEYKNEQGIDATRNLKIQMKFCNPRCPWEKPFVERVHGTIGTKLLETLPGAVGNSVAAKKRLEETRLKDGDRITLEQLDTHLKAFQTAYHSEKHEGIGMSPNAKWATSKKPITRFDPIKDAEALQLLLSKKTKIRTIQGKGIKWQKEWYYDFEGDWSTKIKSNVSVQATDDGCLRVYTLDKKELLFIARPDSSYDFKERMQAVANAKAKSGIDRSKGKKAYSKARKNTKIITYPEMYSVDNVVAFESREKVDEEILETSHSARVMIDADKLARQEHQAKRDRERAATQEDKYDKYLRLLALGDKATPEEQSFAAHYPTTAEGKSMIDFWSDDTPLELVRRQA
jgi:Integrase core domain/Mu DNA-binding domain